MEKHLKESVQENMVGDISPISPIDAEIIVEIKEALKKHRLDDLASIVGEWKNLDDSEIRDMLIDYNINKREEENEEEGVKGGKKKHTRSFILFENISLDVHWVVSVGRGRYFDFQKGEYEYVIKINEFTNDNSIYHDLRIKCLNHNDLEEKYALLLELMKDTGTINFY